MALADKMLTCRECNSEFAFTVGEQEFHAQKGFTNEPSRCPECRARRKAERGSDRGYSSGGGGYGGGSSYGEPRRQREMFPAVCASCNQATQVPFEPRGDKPVYCSACFNERGGGGGGGGRSYGGRY
jgi:CxxC-x17-CxxC domain-containing protein